MIDARRIIDLTTSLHTTTLTKVMPQTSIRLLYQRGIGSSPIPFRPTLAYAAPGTPPEPGLEKLGDRFRRNGIPVKGTGGGILWRRWSPPVVPYRGRDPIS